MSAKTIENGTILHRLQDWAVENPNSVAQRYREKFNKTAPWTDITAAQFRDRVVYLALFLESKGVTTKDIGAIYSYNCPQWVQTEMALMLMGAKSAGIYPNSVATEIAYILNHTECTVLGVQDKKSLAKIGTANLPKSLTFMIAYDDDDKIAPNAIGFSTAIFQGEQLAKKSGKTTTELYQAYLNKIDPKSGAFLIYTSGTTGEPKGAVLSHDNLSFTSDLVMDHWQLPKGDGNLFSFLPLCHIAEKLQNIGVGITCRLPVTFCTRLEYVMVELPQVNPSLLLCVPRVWEKLMEGVQAKVAKSKGAKKKLADWAFEVGARIAAKKYAGEFIGPVDRLQFLLADKLVISKIKAAVGLTNVKKCASGAAALPAHVSKWFQSIGLEILEDFGQTETTGVVCMTIPGMDSSGSVGVAPKGTDFKIADDGEVLTRGRHVFIEYLKNPQATRETVDAEGWLHTGDLAEITPKGLVKIRGRKKEILKSSGGKMVAPLPIEDKIKSSDVVSQVCMVGDGRKYFSALVTLTENTLKDVTVKPDAVAGAVVKDSEIISKVKSKVDEVNRELASYEKIKYFTILSRDFSVDEGEMTPTMKMKRSVIEKRFSAVIDSMYAGADAD